VAEVLLLEESLNSALYAYIKISVTHIKAKPKKPLSMLIFTHKNPPRFRWTELIGCFSSFNLAKTTVFIVVLIVTNKNVHKNLFTHSYTSSI
jgi:hypothetical protein